MPKLWRETIEAHRREVRDAILDTAAALVAERGLASVTMSQIAEAAGIGRATLYKYFPDVEAILVAWHDRQVKTHLDRLATIRDRPGSAGERLAAVLETYALMSHESRRHHGTDVGTLAALLHREEHQQAHAAHHREHVARAQQQLSALLQDLLAEAASTGEVRNDVPPEELASYCLHALAAAGRLPSTAAVQRLVTVILDGLRPQPARAAADRH